MIHCTVTAARCYSADLVQGGLEIPCILKFEGSEKYAMKAEKLIRSALSTEQSTSSTNQPDSKEEDKRKNESPTNDSPSDSPTVVAKKRKLTDTLGEQESGIMRGEKLSDMHVNFVQCLLKKQFNFKLSTAMAIIGLLHQVLAV